MILKAAILAQSGESHIEPKLPPSERSCKDPLTLCASGGLDMSAHQPSERQVVPMGGPAGEGTVHQRSYICAGLRRTANLPQARHKKDLIAFSFCGIGG